MALTELLQRRSGLFIPRNAFQRSVRCLSSLSLDSENDKSSDTAKQQRAEIVEASVEKYVEKHPGISSKATHEGNEVGGSWYTVKESLQRFKENILGAPQPDNAHSLIDSAPALAPSASKSNPSDQPDYSGAHADLAVIPKSMDENIRHSPINAPADSSSDMVVDTTASDVTNIHDSSGSSELHATFVSVKSERKASGIEKDASANVTSLVSQTEDTMELNAVSDSSQLQLENGSSLYNEIPSIMRKKSVRDSVLNTAKLYTGNRDQQENKEFTSRLFLNLCSDMTDKSTLRRSSEKIHSLADLFRNYMDGVAESKNGHLQLEGLHLDTLSLERERISPVNSSDESFSSSESASNMKITGPNKSVSIEYEDHPTEEEMTISSETQSLVPKEMDPFATTKKIEGFTINNLASKVKNNINSDMFMERYMGHLEDHKEKDAAKNFEIKCLIDSIKKLPRVTSTSRPQENTLTHENNGISNKSLPQENTSTHENNGISNKSLRGGTKSLAISQGLGKKGRKVMEGTGVCGKLEDDTERRPKLVVSASVKSVLTNKKESNEMKDKFFLSEESDQNKVVVKFLKNVTEKDVYDAFQDCGDISKVEVSNVVGAFYQVAYVYFRTRAGLRKAVEKTDLYIRNTHTTAEAVDSVGDISNKIPVPSLIGTPDVPAALIRNPTRTVMIRKLTKDISSRHIEAALTFCGSSVTGFFLGSSSSVAYVEFETEEGKETALARRSIGILGEQLLISQIDIPRTTVVRISHHPSIKMRNIVQVCKAAGEVKETKIRCKGLVDVHYRVTEWPNMLNILNRLNGIQIDGWPLLAQPATVIPPEILRVLWHQPEERKYVKAMVQKLLHKVGENVPIRADFLDLIENFYRDKL